MRSALIHAAAVLGVAATWGAAGCTAKPTFICNANDACVSEENDPGICEPSGFCSFPDNGCPDSGRRYADGAGNGLASSCVTVVAAQRCIQHISLGKDFACLVKTDGSVWCWGNNTAGQLGDGTTTTRTLPTKVAFGARIASVGEGEEHTCALDTDGNVWCWGSNDTHQLGVGDQNSLVPEQATILVGTPPKPIPASSLSVGGKHACALADKVVYCWGENSDGQCGQDPAKADDVEVPTAVPAFEGVVQPAVGDEFSCALKDDKTVWCWGANNSGELGNGTTAASFVPVKVLLASVGQLAAGDEHACGIKDDGSAWCWGYGNSGEIGVGNDQDQHAPVSVTSANALFAGGSAFGTCAVKGDATLLCWGANDSGQIGAGLPDAKVFTPTKVQLVTVKEAAIGEKFACAITLDGSLWCWGANDVGQLGLGTTGAPQPSPRRVSFACP